jgi:hypothetical protein
MIPELTRAPASALFIMRLPVELLDHTIKYLPRPSQTEDAKDLKACALVSRHLNATCRPLLFATIELGPEVPLTALAHIRPVTRGVITTLRFDLADACPAYPTPAAVQMCQELLPNLSAIYARERTVLPSRAVHSQSLTFLSYFPKLTTLHTTLCKMWALRSNHAHFISAVRVGVLEDPCASSQITSSSRQAPSSH